MKRLKILFVAAVTAISSFSPAAAQSRPGGQSAETAPVATMLGAGQRAAIARELVAKWAPTVKASSGGNVPRWTARLTSEISTADVENVLRATAMPTFELMHAALNGYVPTATEMVQSTRPSSSRSAIGNATVAPQAIGDTFADLTYTPLAAGRCRIADSRVINSPLPSAVERHITVTFLNSYGFQGGSGPYPGGGGSFACGLPNYPTAFAISVTLLDPAGDGTFKLYPFFKPHQTAATSIFNAGTFGASENLIVTACVECANDISIRTSAQVHYVIDVIGYFMRPVATALSCVETAVTTTNVAAGATANIVAPLCAAGYTQTATNCESASWQMPFVYLKAGACSAQNNSNAAATLRSSRTCCRVPGR